MKIVIALSSTKNNTEVLTFSSMIAQQGNQIILLMVVKNEKIKNSAEVEDTLAEARLILGHLGLKTNIRVGDFCDQINQEIETGDHDLLILREKTTSYFDRWIHRFPSVHVAEHVPCSVIIFKGKAKPIQKILLCDSGAGNSSYLNDFTAELTDHIPGEEKVTVLHVMSQISAGPGISGEDLRASTEELIKEKSLEGLIVDKDVHNLEHHGIESVPKIRHGFVVEEILAEAQSGNYELVIIGAHTAEHLQRFILENIAKQIMKRINKPVLVVRDKEGLAFAD